MTNLITEPPAQWLQDIIDVMEDEQREERMSNLIHIALATAPSGGTAYIGMTHAADYRDDITGYEIVSADTGMGCDVCGYLISECI